MAPQRLIVDKNIPAEHAQPLVPDGARVQADSRPSVPHTLPSTPKVLASHSALTGTSSEPTVPWPPPQGPLSQPPGGSQLPSSCQPGKQLLRSPRPTAGRRQAQCTLQTKAKDEKSLGRACCMFIRPCSHFRISFLQNPHDCTHWTGEETERQVLTGEASV